MAFPRSLRIVRDQETIAESVAARSAAESPVPHVREATYGLTALLTNNLQARASRTTAMQVPAFADAVKTYTHVISAFPLREYVGDDAIVPRPFLQKPSPILPYSAVITRLVTDLLLFDRAYLLVTGRDWQGFPNQIQVMRVEDVNDLTTTNTGIDNNSYPPSDPFYWLGNRVQTRDVLKFYGDGSGGWLANGATAINTAAALEAATLMYSESPIPSVALKNSGADLSADQVDALLEAWETARANRGTAYLNSSIDAQTMGFSARDVQLVEAKATAALQIARLCNIDPVFVGAAVPGSSLTYANRVDLYRQLLDLSLSPVMALVQQRLSMDDVTPRGHAVKFDTSLFLRQNPSELATLITQLVPLGVLTTEQAQQVLDLPTLGVSLTPEGITQ